MSYWKTREGSRKLLSTKRGENQTVEIVVTKIENRGTMTWQEFVENCCRHLMKFGTLILSRDLW